MCYNLSHPYFVFVTNCIPRFYTYFRFKVRLWGRRPKKWRPSPYILGRIVNLKMNKIIRFGTNSRSGLVYMLPFTMIYNTPSHWTYWPLDYVASVTVQQSNTNGQDITTTWRGKCSAPLAVQWYRFKTYVDSLSLLIQQRSVASRQGTWSRVQKVTGPEYFSHFAYCPAPES